MILDPFVIKNHTFKNRIMMSPMCMYQVYKKDGVATNFHYTHYTARALGGVGYIMIESTAVLPNGRITYEDLGLWSDSQIEPLKKIVEGVHALGAKIGIQLSHAGRKSRTENIVSSTNQPFSESYSTPERLSPEGIKEIVNAFKTSARRAREIGFDSIELHGAHGYLINQFMSPLVNDRDDEYKDGLKFLEEIIDAVRSEMDRDQLLQFRISAYEYDDLGLTPYDWASILNVIKHKIDVIDISSGGVIPNMVNDYPGYQLPYAKIIKEETGMITISGGQIDNLELAEQAIQNQDLDMVFFGRKLLIDPFFIYKYDESLLPTSYKRASTLIKSKS